MSRPLAALASLALTGLGLLVLLPDCAYACSCGPVSTQRLLSSSEAVFSGEVVDLKRDQKGPFGGVDKVSFRVSEVWKGPERGTLEVKNVEPRKCLRVSIRGGARVPGLCLR